jgi:hypothetical protein
MKGKCRFVKMPDDTADYPDMVEPADIRVDRDEANVIAPPWTYSFNSLLGV